MANILVVDDDPSVLNAIEGVLRDTGHSAKVISDGAEAIREVRTGSASYDAVLVDWRMRFPGGFSSMMFAAILRGAKVVAMVGSGFHLPAEFRAKLGGVLAKPFTASGLVGVLESLDLRGGAAT